MRREKSKQFEYLHVQTKFTFVSIIKFKYQVFHFVFCFINDYMKESLVCGFDYLGKISKILEFVKARIIYNLKL